jgi:hypothetical protein
MSAEGQKCNFAHPPSPEDDGSSFSTVCLALRQRGVPRLWLAAYRGALLHRVAVTSIRGRIPLDNLDTPYHCHKILIRHADGDIVERAAANCERFRRRGCRATGRTGGNLT